MPSSAFLTFQRYACVADLPFYLHRLPQQLRKLINIAYGGTVVLPYRSLKAPIGSHESQLYRLVSVAGDEMRRIAVGPPFILYDLPKSVSIVERVVVGLVANGVGNDERIANGDSYAIVLQPAFASVVAGDVERTVFVDESTHATAVGASGGRLRPGWTPWHPQHTRVQKAA